MKKNSKTLYKVIPYRDNDGAIISSAKPILKLEGYASGGYKIARYIWCPEIEGLRFVGICASCNLFRGREIYKGVRCGTNKPLNAGKTTTDKYI